MYSGMARSSGTFKKLQGRIGLVTLHMCDQSFDVHVVRSQNGVYCFMAIHVYEIGSRVVNADSLL